jgi:uncharacterized membrane protein
MWRKISQHELRDPLLALAGASALATFLITTRAILMWRGQHLFLVWNLILAWVPLLLALRIESMHERATLRGWRFWGLAAAWLLFFPNAPYIFTDLIHLKLIAKPRWWTDMILILLFAITGLVLAFLALHRMHRVVAARRGWVAGWLFVVTVAFLSGFGVYLGRFERWNSWDVLTNPFNLMADSIDALHPRSAKFTILFGLFLATAYALLYSLTLLRPGPRVPALVRREPTTMLET